MLVRFALTSGVPADSYIGRLGFWIVVSFLAGEREGPATATVAVAGHGIKDVHTYIVADTFNRP